MKLRLFFCGIVSGLLLPIAAYHAQAERDDNSLDQLGEPGPSRDQRIDELRAQGPEGLTAAIGFKKAALQQHAKTMLSCSFVGPWRDAEYWQLLDQAIDQIGGQRYASESELYWYTDWDKAAQASRDSNRPILALKMMGKLTDEYSCANSRFFRTTLYLDPAIRQTLQKDFVLYWNSVRPVPKVTIDYGDGRIMERTLTGNSAHYVVSTKGHVFDCLPGLNSPTSFLSWLDEMKSLADQPGNSVQSLAAYHQRKLNALHSSGFPLNAVSQTPGNNTPGNNTAIRSSNPTDRLFEPAIASEQQKPAAAVAMVRAVSKSRVEAPLLSSHAINESVPFIGVTVPRVVELSEESRQMIIRENPQLDGASTQNLLQRFCDTIGQDERLNQQLHTIVHQWLSEGAPRELVEFNDRVYSELFLTPSSDSWLGMGPSDFYTGLVDGGLKTKHDQYHYDRR
jgi:hypothetical protein